MGADRNNWVWGQVFGIVMPVGRNLGYVFLNEDYKFGISQIKKTFYKIFCAGQLLNILV